MHVRRSSTTSCPECGILERTEWSVLSDAAFSILWSSRTPMHHGPGDILFHQGDPADGLYCVRAGYVALKNCDAFGTETMFRIAESGETLGWRSFFGKQPHAASAVALTDCRTCLIPTQTVMGLIRQDGALALRFLRSLASDKGPIDGLLLRSPRLPVHIRLIHLLLVLRGQCAVPMPPDGLLYHLRIKRKDIAAMIGARIETVSRAIQRLEIGGLVRFNGREVTVPNVQQLLDAVKLEKLP